MNQPPYSKHLVDPSDESMTSVVSVLLERVSELERADRERAAHLVKMADLLGDVSDNGVTTTRILAQLLDQLITRGVLPDTRR